MGMSLLKKSSQIYIETHKKLIHSIIVTHHWSTNHKVNFIYPHKYQCENDSSRFVQFTYSVYGYICCKNDHTYREIQKHITPHYSLRIIEI